jgi:hypothetical protein
MIDFFFNLDFYGGFMSALFCLWIAVMVRNRMISGGSLALYVRHLADRNRPVHALWCPYCRPEKITQHLQYRGY